MTLKKMIFLFSIFIFITACKPICEPGTVTTMLPPFPAFDPATYDSSEGLIEVEIKGKLREVNRVIQGPLCNDTWEGIIYVACDIQVAAWEEDPIFLRECDLNIDEDTTVYVAQHNDKQYNKGCSCHE